VNVARRVTGLAHPGTVLVSESVREAIGSADEFSSSFAGGRHLKGVKGRSKAVPRSSGHSRKRLTSNLLRHFGFTGTGAPKLVGGSN
jgi:class 3 adenylate cyclase